MVTFAFFSGPLPWVILGVATIVFLWVDLHFFARGREPSFREGAYWSIGWLVFSLLVGVVVLMLSDADDAITYTTVYFIERSLSLDNLFVFLLLFAYFGIPEAYRARLLFWGIAAALVGHAEVSEQQQEDEEVVERERALDQVDGGVEHRVLAALVGPHRERGRQAQHEPADRPPCRLLEARLAPAREEVQVEPEEEEEGRDKDGPGRQAG